MRLTLRSDFRDFYDSAFDEPTEGTFTFPRLAKGGPPKREQFSLLEQAGFKTPPHGLVCDIMARAWPEEYWSKFGENHGPINLVVAYEDENAHCAEGKRLLRSCQITSNPDMSGRDRFERENSLYCSAYVHPKGYRGVEVQQGESLRHLQVGPHVFYVLYTSKVSWMSNEGEGDIELVSYELNKGFNPAVKWPLWAVDLVPGRSGLYAVDFNTAPGVRGTGVEKVLKPSQFVDALRAFYGERN